MGDETARFKPYAMSLAFTSIIFISNRIVSSGFRNLSDISFKFKHLAFVLVLFLVIYYLLKKKELWNVNKKTKISLLFVSLLFSVLNVLGTQMAYTNRLTLNSLRETSPVFTIVMPVFNSESYLEKCL